MQKYHGLIMRGMRNIAAHEYFRVDLGIVWKTSRESLPALASKIKKINISMNIGE